MIAAILTALEADLKAAQLSGGVLSGFALAEAGPRDPKSIPDQQHPALIVDVETNKMLLPRGDTLMEMSGAMTMTIYTLSMAAYRDAALAAWRLWLSDDKRSGLARFLALHRGYFFQNGAIATGPVAVGQPCDGWALDPGEARMLFGAQHAKGGYTMALRVPIGLRALLPAVS